ncbi:MAG: DUF922 domain-containing protein [Notoacmeibacter sp.]|nr:DUF922 domain-containing protein [Notoacmeibacter sp.]
MSARALALLAALLLALPARAEIRATEVEKTYAIAGATGAELYESIGEHGPAIREGAASAIAYTTFDLKWRRDYRRDGDACVLAAATPFLTITYTLPKPAGRLPPETAARWRAFIDGIRAHEKAHGAMIRDLVADILATTIGFRQDDDPGCKQIRKAIYTPLNAAYDRHKARSRAFDADEMGPGGNVQKLILKLVK